MKVNKFLIVLLALALVFSLALVGCNGDDEPAEPNGNEEPGDNNGDNGDNDGAAEEPAAETYTASDPANQPKIDMIFPNLTIKVEDGDITQERMDEILQLVGDGEMSIPELQAIMGQ